MLRNKTKKVFHILLVILLSVFAWKEMHKPPAIDNDVFPYLLNIPTEVILQCQVEGRELSTTGWADLIALKTTFNNEQVSYAVRQLQNGTPFHKIDWSSELLKDQEEQIKQVKWRRDLLLKYPYYEPQRFLFPVVGEVWYQDSYGADREGGARRHEGTDLFSPEGTPIVSACSGHIEKLGWNRLGGERVGVRGKDGNYYYYAHLQTIDESLEIGEKIEKGDPIGTMGHTGDAVTTPDHLHFGIELPSGEWINPYPFLYIWQNQN